MTCVDGFRMTGFQGNMTLRMDSREDTYNLDSAIAWRYSEDAVALLLSSHDSRCAVIVRLSSDNCAELIEKLSKSFQK